MSPAALLEFLVSIPSISGAERELAERLDEMLSLEGFVVRREEDNVWFSLGTDARPHLLLLSHLDTIPPCGGWESDPHKPVIRDGRLIGLGANDAKGCVAAMILAARELREVPIEGKVTFAFVTQEERGSEGIRATKPKLGALDAAVVGEPTALEVCAAQRGMLILKCTAHGEAAHVAHADLGDNAIHKAARDVTRLAEMTFESHAQLGAARAQVTQISGGLARNQVPDRCEFFVDVRTTPNLNHTALAATIDAALESEVTIYSGRYESVATDIAEPIVQAALKAAGKAETVASHTTSDWVFLTEIPAVKAGPGDTARSHCPNEYLLISELEAGAQFYTKLALAYFSMKTEEVAHA